MCDQIKNASLEWQDERTPISIKFDEPYFSIFNGLDEQDMFFYQETIYVSVSIVDFMLQN